MSISSRYAHGRVSGHRNSGASQTVQSDGPSTRISNILRRYANYPAPAAPDAALFADVSRFGDFGDVLDRVNEGRRLFMSLPSEVRRVYDHDALAFFNDVSLHPERLQELGILKPKAVPTRRPKISPVEASKAPTEENASTKPQEAEA